MEIFVFKKQKAAAAYNLVNETSADFKNNTVALVI